MQALVPLSFPGHIYARIGLVCVSQIALVLDLATDGCPLLMQVAGTSGKVQQSADEESEGISSDAHGLAILEALGLERRNEVRTHYLDV